MSENKLKKFEVTEIKDSSDIIKLCKENNVPIILTENDEEKVIMMSIDVYGELFYKIQKDALINNLKKEL